MGIRYIYFEFLDFAHILCIQVNWVWVPLVRNINLPPQGAFLQIRVTDAWNTFPSLQLHCRYSSDSPASISNAALWRLSFRRLERRLSASVIGLTCAVNRLCDRGHTATPPQVDQPGPQSLNLGKARKVRSREQGSVRVTRVTEWLQWHHVSGEWR